MSTDTETIDRFVEQEYKWGFYTDVEADTLPPGLDEEVVRHISGKKTSRIGSPSGDSSPFVIGKR